MTAYAHTAGGYRCAQTYNALSACRRDVVAGKLATVLAFSPPAPETMRKGYQQLLDEANARIDALDCERARRLLDDPGVQFVDLRDTHELERHGMIPGAFHAPRGNLEFWVDPQSPYHRPVFASGKHFVFYCGGGWRSALATLAMMEMGLAPVSHLAGGFSAWRAAGAPIVARPPDPAKA